MRRQPRLSANQITVLKEYRKNPALSSGCAGGKRGNMKLVEVKFEIPEDLEPRIAALAAQMGLSFDMAAQLLIYNGYVTHLRSSIEWSEQVLSASESEGATV